MTWLLLLTLAVDGGGAAIMPIPGYVTEAQCEAAGKAWVATIPDTYLIATYSCSPHGG